MKLILFTTGEVTSPNYPNNYPNGLEKTQTIRVEEGLIISLQFTAFDIEVEYAYDYDSYDFETSDYEFDYESIIGCRDHLTITDGDGTTLMEKSCGNSLPADIRSTSNVVNLLFSTSGLGTSSGWSVSWRAVTPGECQQHLWMFLLNFIKFF